MQETGLIPPGQTTGTLSTIKCNWIQSRFIYRPENYKVPLFGLETHLCPTSQAGTIPWLFLSPALTHHLPPLLFKKVNKGKIHQVFWWVENSSKFSIPSLKTAYLVTQRKPMQSRARCEVIMIHTFLLLKGKLYYTGTTSSSQSLILLVNLYRGRMMHPHSCTKQTSFWSLRSRLKDLC